MRVLVAGSRPDDVPSDHYELICHDIADELVRRGFEIILGSDRDTTADYFVFEHLKATGALRKAEPRVRVTFCYPDGKPVPFDGEARHLNAHYKQNPGQWTSARIPQVQLADLIITIGGADKTTILGLIARHLAKPFVPVFPSGGSSKESWSRMRSGFQRSPSTMQYIDAIETWIGPDSAKAVLDLACEEKRVLKEASSGRVLYLSCCIIFCLANWFYLLIHDAMVTEGVKVFLVTSISCLLGTCLPLIADEISAERSVLSSRGLWLMPLASLILAFVIFISYVFSGYVVGGYLDFFTKLGNRADFVRVALVLSLLGVSAGIFFKERIRKLSAEGIPPLS